MQRVLYIFCWLFILVSCTTIQQIPQNEVLGKYKWKGAYVDYSTLEFKNDSSFVYTW